MKKLFPLLLLVLFFATCDDDEMPVDPYTQELRIDLVTGLQVRDVNAVPLAIYGNPNTFPGQVDFYPNPAIGQANIQYYGGAGLQVRQYWIFPAEKNTDYAAIDYNILLNNSTYSPDDVAARNVVATDLVNLPAFALNLDNLAPGYYRIFYLMSDNTLYWDNIYVDPSASNLEVLANEVGDDF